MTAINNARPVRGLAFLVAAGLLTRAAAAAPRPAFSLSDPGILVLGRSAAAVPASDARTLSGRVRVDHTGSQQWVLVAQLPVGAHVQKVLSHVGAGPVDDLGLGGRRRLFTHRLPLRRRTVKLRSVRPAPLVACSRAPAPAPGRAPLETHGATARSTKLRPGPDSPRLRSRARHGSAAPVPPPPRD